jgi:hypothetical protein
LRHLARIAARLWPPDPAPDPGPRRALGRSALGAGSRLARSETKLTHPTAANPAAPLSSCPGNHQTTPHHRWRANGEYPPAKIRTGGAPESRRGASYGASSVAQGGAQEAERAPVCPRGALHRFCAVPQEDQSKGTAGAAYCGVALVAIENPHPQLHDTPRTRTRRVSGLSCAWRAGWPPKLHLRASRLPKKRRVSPSARRFLFPVRATAAHISPPRSHPTAETPPPPRPEAQRPPATGSRRQRAAASFSLCPLPVGTRDIRDNVHNVRYVHS